MKIVGKRLKFLISIDSFLSKTLYRIFLIFTCHCNIRFPYRIRKVIRNIYMNTLGYDGKSYEVEMGLRKLYVVHGYVRNNGRHLSEKRSSWFRV